MTFWVVFGIALGLAMDAFAVAIATAVVLGRVSQRQTFRLAFHFGLFQFLMPVIGWLAGTTVEVYIRDYDHWVAFGLLAAVGGKAIWESLQKEEEEAGDSSDPTKGVSLIVLSIATSIDALAVGLSFSLLVESIWYPSVVIGLVAAGMTFLGLRLGARLGERFGKRMELAGGLVLLGIGIKILAEHL